MNNEYRIEKDSMGELKVPTNANYGAQTQRAVENFTLSQLRMPAPFIRALGLIKSSAAEVNSEFGLVDAGIAAAIGIAADEIANGQHLKEFPVDVFQTGSGTSSNMNANEVIAHLASRYVDAVVHPNDHVNYGQSSNDVIPTAIHVSACVEIHKRLLPALENLAKTIERRMHEHSGVVKTGRTHLMDAMPVRLDQELGAWRTQIIKGKERINGALENMQQLALGGTAVGTGVNAHKDFGPRVAIKLKNKTGIAFKSNEDLFEALSTLDAVVEMSGQLKTVAVSLMKISNDLRWMNSGPLAGLGEISLPALQPGSSIMPGKVNPVIPEAVAMVCAQVIGNDATITIAGQSGNFQLNVMLPVSAYNILQSIELLTNAANTLADKAIAGFAVDEEKIKQPLYRNPILVTSLNKVIGYGRGAAIAKQAYAEGRAVVDVAEERTNIARDELETLLDPEALTEQG